MLLPDQVQIQTVDYCNRRCAFCPNSKLQKSPETLMPLDVFDKILGDLAAVGFTGRLHLYLMGDPLCDPRIEQLIAWARERFPANTIFISTNGDGFKGAADITRLIDAGLSWMAISHYDSRNEHLKAYRDKRVEHVTLNDLRWTFYNRGGHVQNVTCIEPKRECDWLWMKSYINWRGDVVLCCSDYNYEVVFGNVMERPFAEIFNSDLFNAYREAHRSGRGKSMPLCRGCNRIKSVPGGKALNGAALSCASPA